VFFAARPLQAVPIYRITDKNEKIALEPAEIKNDTGLGSAQARAGASLKSQKRFFI
tara:strand:+ start:532 stop:699 length:168 start_codon:yes stop_codon:yes gene_type:complete